MRNTIIKQISPQIAINVKRKFKLGSGNKIVKWWHVVSGNEEIMDTGAGMGQGQGSDVMKYRTLSLICRRLRSF